MRGIRPKKDHDGYVVLNSREWIKKYTEEVWESEEHAREYKDDKYRAHAIKRGYLRLEKKTAHTWRSTLQTPYSASLPIEPVRSRVKEEIRTVLGDIGVASYIIEADKDTSCDCQPSDHNEGVNRLYRVQYMANYKTGYWEITIYTTKSIQVPENRLPIKLVGV